jgi:hypothetical protein
VAYLANYFALDDGFYKEVNSYFVKEVYESDELSNLEYGSLLNLVEDQHQWIHDCHPHDNKKSNCFHPYNPQAVHIDPLSLTKDAFQQVRPVGLFAKRIKFF